MICSSEIFSSLSLQFPQTSYKRIFITMIDRLNQSRGSNVDLIAARTSLFVEADCMLLTFFYWYLYIIIYFPRWCSIVFSREKTWNYTIGNPLESVAFKVVVDFFNFDVFHSEKSGNTSVLFVSPNSAEAS